MKNIKAVIFDMDGVIFDTEKAYLHIWTDIFEKYGYTLDKNIYISLMGTGKENVMRVFKETFGEDLPLIEMYKEKDEMILDMVRKRMVTVKEGAYELLTYLKENNFKIALETSSRRERLDLQIKMFDIFDMFDSIVCGEDVINGKPSTEIFLKVAKKIGVDPKDCIVIEDSLAGIKGAHAAGMIGFHVEDMKKADDEILMYCNKNFKDLNEIKQYISENILLNKKNNKIKQVISLMA